MSSNAPTAQESSASSESSRPASLPPMSSDIESVMTLEQFIIDHQERLAHSTGTFSRLIRDISVAAKIINHNIRRAGILDVFGTSGDVNVQGEEQKKLDVIADEEFERALRKGGQCCLIGSEESADPTSMNPNAETKERYAVFFDPLDGSSNTDVNASVGTIFSIYMLPDDYDDNNILEAALQKGTEQVAAGYVAYGSSTMLVYTTGNGVDGFTLDPSIGEFLLSHPDIKLPSKPSVYSINEADVEDFSKGIRDYMAWLKLRNKKSGRRLRGRYIGSFVSDFHRNLLTGGVYVYPSSTGYTEGKLRLMYEANPMAFLVEQAGGKASTGTQRIMEIEPTDLHQRTPIIIGSPDLVDAAEAFIAGDTSGLPQTPVV